MKHLLHKIKHLGAPLALITLLLLPGLGWGQTNPTPHDLSVANYSFTGFASGETTTYPTSMQGWSFSSEPTSSTVTPATADRVLAINSSGIASGSIRNEVGAGISLLNSSSNNIGAIAVSLNTTGRENITVTWTAQQLNSGGSGATDRINGLQLQYRVGTSGNFTSIPSTEYLTTNTTSQNSAQTFTNIQLPSACDNQSVVQVRWIYYISSGTANGRDRINLDEIQITSQEVSGTPTAASPTFTPGTGTYYSAQDVEIATETEGATIYYTTDGSDPDNEGTVYTEAITVSSTTTIKAIAYATGYDPSAIASATYTFPVAQTTTIPYAEDFTAGIGQTYSYSVSGDSKIWTYNAGGFMNMNGFGGAAVEEDWLVLPGLNLDNYTGSKILTFDTWYNFGTINADNYLKLYYSTDYAGVGDPTSSTWTELSYTQPASTSTWTFSGDVDLSAISGTSVYIAFKYRGITSGYNSWSVDNISIQNPKYAVTFNVDMNGTSGYTNVYVAGTFNGWNTTASQMTTSGGNIYTFSTDAIFDSSDEIEFKFVKDGTIYESISNRTYTVVSGTNIYNGYWNSATLPQLDFVNLQYPASGTISAGDAFDVYAQVYEAGLTEAAGQGSNVSCWIGYSTENTNPNTWTEWVLATFNVQSGNNDEYTANIGTGLTGGTYYYASRFKYGLNDYVFGGYSTNPNGGFWDGSNNISGVLTVNAAEPAAHVTDFAATGDNASSITLTWSDANPSAENYLIKGSNVSYEAIIAPIDGTPETDGGLIKNVAAGVQTYQFTNLSATTAYYFKIFPYNGSGSQINFRTVETIPQASATTPAMLWIEDFETGTKASYAAGDVTCTKGSWNLTESVLGTLANDRKNGLQSVRMRYSSSSQYGELTMNFDKSDGAGSVSVYHAKYGTDVDGSWKLQMSTNAGSTWSDVGSTVNTTSTTLTAQNFEINQTGNVRFKIIQMSGNRINIDDFKITDYSIPVFTGTGNWTETARWSNGEVPIGTENVIIEGNVTVNDVVECNDLTIASSGTVTVGSGQGLIVNGNFLIQSDASGTGSFIGAADDYDIEGTQTVERYISGHNNVADAGWHLLGSPVAAFDIDGSSFDPGASDDFYAWQESNSTWMNHKQGTPSQIVPGTGYLVSYETSGTKTFTGALNAADQTVTVTREGAGDYAGFNLIGNPFASAITWGSGWSLGSVGGVAYVWDEATKDYIDIEAGDPIPSANGVMVYLGGEETSQSLTIPAAARIHSSQGWYKSAGGRIVLVANDPDRGAAKRSVIRFNESATEGFDLAWDGYYLRGFAPGFYSVSNGMNYSVNTLPSMNNTLVIPMGFEKTVSSGFSIELQESIPGAVVYLTDKKTGTVTNLTDNGAYHFTAAEGDDANRFTLHFGTLGMDDPSTAAPVHIYAYGGVVYLNGLDVKASVTITDLTGRVVMAERVNGNGLAMLNAGSLPKGVYVVTAVAGSRVVSAKVIL